MTEKIKIGKITKPRGKLGVLLPGMGAVATTFVIGALAARKRKDAVVGSLTQTGRIRVGKRTENRNPLMKDFLPLADMKDLVFGGWDIFNENAYETALRSDVLVRDDIEPFKKELKALKPMPGVFDRKFVKRLEGNYFKKGKTKMHLAEALRRDIRNFKKKNKCGRLVMVLCISTEVYSKPSRVHKDPASFEEGLRKNSPRISPAMIYAYAALKEGVPYANGTPSLSNDIPALLELAEKNKVPVAGKDYKTGQTLLKTIIAPGLKARMLGVEGWFSTNILGNRDGLVLDEEGSLKSKEVSKSSVLGSIFEPDLYPKLYKNLYHKVDINYYPPSGDNKESWDNTDIFGWMGYKMQIKVNFLCRDSILAAPVVLDLALFLDIASRAGLYGVQEWLSFYFKSPLHHPDVPPVNDLFVQREKLFNTLRFLKGEKLIHHLGLTYYGFDEEGKQTAK